MGGCCVFIASVVRREFLYAHTHVLYAPRHTVLNLFMTGLRTMDQRPRGFTPIFINTFIALADGSQTISQQHSCSPLCIVFFVKEDNLMNWDEKEPDTLFKSHSQSDGRAARHLLLMKGTLQPDLYVWNSLLSDSVDFNNLFEIITNLLVCA
jgi:hypothetical protein